VETLVPGERFIPCVIGPGYIFELAFDQWFRTKGSDVMSTVLGYLFLPTELLWDAGTRPFSIILWYFWYSVMLVGTTQYCQYY
jgi:hypothetical protein